MKRILIVAGACLALLLLGAARPGPPVPGPPTKHPSQQHVYALAGDSIFATTYLPLPDRLVTRLTTLVCGSRCGQPLEGVVTDHAVGGQLLVGPGTSLANTWPSILASSPRPTSVIVEIGTNDLFGTTDAQFEAAYLQLASQATAAGEVIMPCLITPLNTAVFGLREPQLERFNAWLLAMFGPDFVIDLWTPLLAPGTHDLAAQYDSGDGMHPNAAGVDVMAHKIFARL